MSYVETTRRIREARSTGRPIDDETARAVASHWHSPSPYDRNITAVSHERFEVVDWDDLRDEVARERRKAVRDVDWLELTALLDWIEVAQQRRTFTSEKEW